MARWTSEQALGLAPDSSSVRAARSVANPRPWSSAGTDGRALWGLCEGSGRSRYQVSVDLQGPAFKCSCPSRKHPCKHSLGLLLVWSAYPDHVAEGAAEPEWVAEWIASRDERAGQAERAGAEAADAAKPPTEKKAPDPEARAKRAANREARITAGMEELDRWLRDLVRQGLASAPSRPFAFWDTVGARMVDAQAPAAGGAVRRMAGTVRSGDGWPDRLLQQTARLHLLAKAWSHVSDLPAETQDDIKAALGWSRPSEEVLTGPRIRAAWHVMAQVVTEEERLTSQRTWLWTPHGQPALVLEFAPTGAPLPADLLVGTVVDAELVFYPGSVPMRALVANRFETTPITTMPGWPRVEDALGARARWLAANPWLERLPLALSEVTPFRRGSRWAVRDAEGSTVDLVAGDDAGWTLLALSGGRPIGLGGEWSDDHVRPLSAWTGTRLSRIHPPVVVAV